MRSSLVPSKMEPLRDREHLLTLKVMRLTKPALQFHTPITCEDHDLPEDIFRQSFNALGVVDGLEAFSLGEMLTLPQSFGNIFLGETFTSYINVQNDSTVAAKDIQIKLHIQTEAQRHPLPLNCMDENASLLLQPSENVNEIVSYDVKELGIHVLGCSVGYTSPSGEKLHFKKFFKFQVLKPLEVKTKFFVTEDDEVYIEAQVENITPNPMYLDSVKLDPSPSYYLDDINKLLPESGPSSNGKISYLRPMDVRQYLYRLTPVSPIIEKSDKSACDVGKLDIQWLTSFGEKGRLQTSQLQRMPRDLNDLRINCIEIADAVPVEKLFTVKLSVINLTSDRIMNLRLMLDNTKVQPLLWVGRSGQVALGELKPGQSIEVSVNILPVYPGLHVISGLQLLDTFKSKMYTFDKVGQIFVYTTEETPFSE
ncbi:Trafficking protein particle complex subunit 13 [Trichoplax sp. H2]|nr:Trafficking protein particle complex subunit 13 [Trichoplax sp. H2]|eukprot:RDD43676.1 Trafficking protein particle complex subunit 13 [Trichoplax sp. H2]